MSTSILLVGKPWRGGLTRYLRNALERRFPGQVRWIATYPDRPAELRHYRRDRAAWRDSVRREIDRSRCRAALFLNHPTDLGPLPVRDNRVLWITDDARIGSEVYRTYARVFVSDPGYAAQVASVAGERFAGVVPFAHDPQVHRSNGGLVGGTGACAIANCDSKRDLHFQHILSRGLPLRVIGNYFARHRLFWRYPARFRPGVSNDAMSSVYARHAVSLNVHAQVVRGGTNMRTFECAGYGIAQLVEYRSGLESLFEPDVELAVYHSVEEAPEALASLLADPARRARLAQAARVRVLAEHSYDARIETLLGEVL